MNLARCLFRTLALLVAGLLLLSLLFWFLTIPDPILQSSWSAHVVTAHIIALALTVLFSLGWRQLR